MHAYMQIFSPMDMTYIQSARAIYQVFLGCLVYRIREYRVLPRFTELRLTKISIYLGQRTKKFVLNSERILPNSIFRTFEYFANRFGESRERSVFFRRGVPTISQRQNYSTRVSVQVNIGSYEAGMPKNMGDLGNICIGIWYLFLWYPINRSFLQISSAYRLSHTLYVYTTLQYSRYQFTLFLVQYIVPIK
eukprot:TRINITY_DN2746_c4_g1_i2.p2 TRINITY_DN2746_c4_g1~~TRINITY_DN2746_c4_g1_i2.p2  ORF type:complete len:217 (+),score=-16.98 TRINITY_DN2746_c4_g1_i2:81-653(+)